MAKHKLFRHEDDLSPLTENSAEYLDTAIPDPVNLVEDGAGKSKADHKNVQDTNVAEKLTSLDPLQESKSDSDFEDFDSCIINFSSRLPYTIKEDEWILSFVLKDRNIFKVTSISLWKQMEYKKEEPKRTYHSLKNRFLRNIKPNLFTSFSHLITDESKVEEILLKFPELKYKVGRTNTLTRMQLPKRVSSGQNLQETNCEAGPSPEERVTGNLSRRPLSDNLPKESYRLESLILHDPPKYQRKVKTMIESLVVSVNFSSKEDPKVYPNTPRVGIYETYENLKKNNTLVLCTACGRYNQPKINKSARSDAGRESLTSSGESNDLIANSLDSTPTTKTPSKPGELAEADKPTFEPIPCDSSSQSLLNDRGGCGSDSHSNESLEDDEINEFSEASKNSVASREDSPAKDQLMEIDDDLGSHCEDTVLYCRKPINDEDEKLLFRCFHGSPAKLQISESHFQNSLETYFVDLENL